MPQFQLFDLARDPCKKTDVIAQHPQVSEKLKERLAKYIADGRSRPTGGN